MVSVSSGEVMFPVGQHFLDGTRCMLSGATQLAWNDGELAGRAPVTLDVALGNIGSGRMTM